MNKHYGVKIYFSGQIGNQMFHYCLGKILAQQRGLAFDPPAEFVDWKGDPVKWSGEPLFTMRSTDGLRYSGNKSFNFGAYYWYDFAALPTKRAIHVCYGHWCRYELYRDWKEKIRHDWLQIPPDRFVQTDPDAVYIHVRRTDFVSQGDSINTHFQSSSTSLEGFAECLKSLSDYKRIVICTDAPDDPFHAGFDKFGLPVEIQRKSWDEDFLTLASCRQMIMSNSTYSWWAGFLGRAERIACPMFPDTYWGRGDGAYGAEREQYPNLYVDDEPERWILVR